MANNIQTIMRTAAMIYADEQNARTSKTVKRNYVEAVLANENNTPLTIEQIITHLQVEYEIIVQEDEVKQIVSEGKYFVCIPNANSKLLTYYLPKNRYDNKQKQSEYCLSDVINDYLENKNSDVDREKLKDLLHRYLFAMLNTNINAFRQLLEKKKQKKSAVINVGDFGDEEIGQINDFLTWDNEKKDKALFELVCYCIDYASAVNNIDQSDVIKSLKNKCLYLDNALIYRALGINGPYRKSRVQNLLKKCVDSGQSIFISSITRKEFFDTIDFHIEALNQTTPYGKINPNIFNKYTDGYGFCQYYHEWRHDRITYGYPLLKIHIKNEYENLLKSFNIQEDFKQPYKKEDNELLKIEEYADGIKQHKRIKNDNLHKNDAQNMIWIEKNRGGNDSNITDTKFYFLTSDRKLQDWDLEHSQNQPLTMLPSQWMALLLRFFSRTNNDYKSFVSFLIMPKDKPEINDDELQVMLAGISEITENFEKQDDIVSNLLEFERSEKRRLDRTETKKFAKEKLECEFNERLENEKKLNEERLTDLANKNEKLIEIQKLEYEKSLNEYKCEFEKKNKLVQIERIKDKLQLLDRDLKSWNDKNTLINNILDSVYRRKKASIFLMYFVIIAIPIFVIIKYDWNILEKWVCIADILIGAFIFGCQLFIGKSINPKNYFNSCRNKIYNDLCAKYGHYSSEKCDIEQTRTKLEEQLKELETEKLLLGDKKYEM